MRAVQWMAMLTLALCLIITGFTGRLGSFVAAFVAPAALETVSQATGPVSGGPTFVASTAKTGA